MLSESEIAANRESVVQILDFLADATSTGDFRGSVIATERVHRTALVICPQSPSDRRQLAQEHCALWRQITLSWLEAAIVNTVIHPGISARLRAIEAALTAVGFSQLAGGTTAKDRYHVALYLRLAGRYQVAGNTMRSLASALPFDGSEEDIIRYQASIEWARILIATSRAQEAFSFLSQVRKPQNPHLTPDTQISYLTTLAECCAYCDNVQGTELAISSALMIATTHELHQYRNQIIELSHSLRTLQRDSTHHITADPSKKPTGSWQERDYEEPTAVLKYWQSFELGHLVSSLALWQSSRSNRGPTTVFATTRRLIEFWSKAIGVSSMRLTHEMRLIDMAREGKTDPLLFARQPELDELWLNCIRMSHTSVHTRLFELGNLIGALAINYKFVNFTYSLTRPENLTSSDLRLDENLGRLAALSQDCHVSDEVLNVVNALRLLSQENLGLPILLEVSTVLNLAYQKILQEVCHKFDGYPISRDNIEGVHLIDPDDFYSKAWSILRHIDARSFFISYSKTDQRICDQLHRFFAKTSSVVWIDWSHLEAGSNIEDAIRDGIHSTTFMLVVCTNATNASNWVQIEVDLALARQTSEPGTYIIIPLLFEGEPEQSIPEQLRGLRYADFRSHWIVGIQELAQAVASRTMVGTEFKILVK